VEGCKRKMLAINAKNNNVIKFHEIMQKAEWYLIK